MSSKARRPYLMGKESVGDFYKSDVRFLKEVVGRESEFEKPYVDEDYRKMHFDFPWPDWPSFPDLPPWPPLPSIDGPVPGLTLCGITCYAPSDCDEPIWCHPSIWCGTDLGCTLCSWIVEGATIGYTPHLTGVGAWGIDIWIDSTLVEAGGQALIHAQMKDPCGNLCGKDIEVTCKVCPADIAMTWDEALSAETIGQSNTAGVYVKDGLGEYTWTVSGTGFSIPNKTSGVSNVLSADATACGTATITVTDYCGTTKIGYVRCAVGQWLEISFTSCIISGAITEGDGQTRIDKKWKLVEIWHNTCTNRFDGCSDVTVGLCNVNYANCHCLEPGDCHTTMGCTQCLEHGGICNSAGYTKECFSPADCLCCVNSANACNGLVGCEIKCSSDNSKLYEWKC